MNISATVKIQDGNAASSVRSKMPSRTQGSTRESQFLNQDECFTIDLRKIPHCLPMNYMYKRASTNSGTDRSSFPSAKSKIPENSTVLYKRDIILKQPQSYKYSIKSNGLNFPPPQKDQRYSYRQEVRNVEQLDNESQMIFQKISSNKKNNRSKSNLINLKRNALNLVSDNYDQHHIQPTVTGVKTNIGTAFSFYDPVQDQVTRTKYNGNPGRGITNPSPNFSLTRPSTQGRNNNMKKMYQTSDTMNKHLFSSDDKNSPFQITKVKDKLISNQLMLKDIHNQNLGVDNMQLPLPSSGLFSPKQISRPSWRFNDKRFSLQQQSQGHHEGIMSPGGSSYNAGMSQQQNSKVLGWNTQGGCAAGPENLSLMNIRQKWSINQNQIQLQQQIPQTMPVSPQVHNIIKQQRLNTSEGTSRNHRGNRSVTNKRGQTIKIEDILNVQLPLRYKLEEKLLEQSQHEARAMINQTEISSQHLNQSKQDNDMQHDSIFNQKSAINDGRSDYNKSLQQPFDQNYDNSGLNDFSSSQFKGPSVTLSQIKSHFKSTVDSNKGTNKFRTPEHVIKKKKEQDSLQESYREATMRTILKEDLKRTEQKIEDKKNAHANMIKKVLSEKPMLNKMQISVLSRFLDNMFEQRQIDPLVAINEEFQQIAKLYQNDNSRVQTMFKSEFTDFKIQFQVELEKFSETQISIKQKKNEYIDFMFNNQIVIEMIDRNARDFDFKKQIKEAKPETKEFINAIIKTFEALDLRKKALTTNDMRLKLKKQTTGHNVQKKIESQKLKDLKEAFAKGFRQMIINYKNQLLNAENSKFQVDSNAIDIKTVYQLKKKQMRENKGMGTMTIRGETNFSKGRAINYQNPLMIQFREVVQKNYLSHPLSYYESLDESKFNCQLVMKLYELKQNLNEIFPPKLYQNIGDKMDFINKNVYTNDFFYNMYEMGKNQYDQEMIRVYCNLNNMEKEPHDHDCDSQENIGNQQSQCVSDVKMDINNLFIKQINKEKFYKQLKNNTLSIENHNDLESNAIMEYGCIQKLQQIPSAPNFVSFSEHVLYLSQQRVSQEEAFALKHYLKKTGVIPEKRVFRLIIEQCSMSDNALSQILEGIIGQCMCDISNGKIKMQYLQSFLYSNNELGLQSLNAIKALIPNMFDLSLNNLRVKGGIHEGKKYDNSGMLEDILKQIAYEGKNLLKLKLTKMNLKNEGIINRLCETIHYNKFLISLDLSYSQLLPRQLKAIAIVLGQKGQNFRCLNLSYNLLNQKGSDPKDSAAFMDNITLFVKVAKYLNHVNFSGMNFEKEQLISLIQVINSNSEYILALHLNDNGINDDNEFYYDCLEEFQITDEDLIEINRSKTTEVKIHPALPKKYDKLDIDYENYLKQYFDFEMYIQSNENEVANAGKDKIRKMYKDRVLLGKQQKVVDQFKAINKAQVYYGLGRVIDNGMDRFVVSRHYNMPGMVFNQRIKSDYTKQRFFNLASSGGWKLSKTTECYVCQKHQMALIFYDRNFMSMNEDLMEIKNKEFLGKLKKDFLVNYSKFYSMTPIIMGTVVNRGIGQRNFDRKLKMLKAPLFTMLQLLTCRDFTTEPKHQSSIKEAIAFFMQTERYHLLRQLGINKKLAGWEKLLEYNALNNELMDVKNINIPDFSQDLKDKDIFVFSCMLKPGYHQIIIYDPLLERAYCKDFVVNLNLREDIFPEFPQRDKQPKKKRIANSWRTWQEDSSESIFKSFQVDLEHQNSFLVSKYIRCPVDAGNCINILLENFDIIKIYQKHLQFDSSKYPEIDWNRIWVHFEYINLNSTAFLKEKEIIPRSLVELAFIGATRNDDTSGLQSAIQRGELFEFILRLCQAWVYKVYSSKEKVSAHIQRFINLYLKPFYDESTIISQRKVIRENLWLNQLLYDNIETLQKIYALATIPMVDGNVSAAAAALWQALTTGKDEVRPGKISKEKKKEKPLTFKIEHAYRLFEHLKSPALLINRKQIEQSFQFSQMTNLSETTTMNRYKYLNFIEFQEMFCRLAIVSIIEQDTLDYNVHLLLSILYDKLYQEGLLNKQENPLYKVEENLR